LALTLIGGLVGVAMGFAIAFIIMKLGTTTLVTSSSVILALSISALIGIIFGY